MMWASHAARVRRWGVPYRACLRAVRWGVVRQFGHRPFCQFPRRWHPRHHVIRVRVGCISVHHPEHRRLVDPFRFKSMGDLHRTRFQLRTKLSDTRQAALTVRLRDTSIHRSIRINVHRAKRRWWFLIGSLTVRVAQLCDRWCRIVRQVVSHRATGGCRIVRQVGVASCDRCG